MLFILLMPSYMQCVGISMLTSQLASQLRISKCIGLTIVHVTVKFLNMGMQQFLNCSSKAVRHKEELYSVIIWDLTGKNNCL